MITTASAIAALDDAIATLTAHRDEIANGAPVDERRVEQIENDAHHLTGFESYAEAFGE